MDQLNNDSRPMDQRSDRLQNSYLHTAVELAADTTANTSGRHRTAILMIVGACLAAVVEQTVFDHSLLAMLVNRLS